LKKVSKKCRKSAKKRSKTFENVRKRLKTNTKRSKIDVKRSKIFENIRLFQTLIAQLFLDRITGFFKLWRTALPFNAT